MKKSGPQKRINSKQKFLRNLDSRKLDEEKNKKRKMKAIDISKQDWSLNK